MSEIFEYGSVYQLIREGKPVRRRDGSAIWCVDYKDDTGKRVTKSTFRAKAHAAAFLSDTRQELKQGVHTPDRDSATVAEACRLWLEVCEQEENLRDSTLKGYREHVRLYISPLLGDVRLSRLRAAQVEEFIGAIKRGGERRVEKPSKPGQAPEYEVRQFAGSAAMARKVLVSLKAAIGVAMRRGKVAQNVALSVKVTRKADDPEREEVIIPTQAEMNKLLEAAKAGNYRKSETGKPSPVHPSWRPMLHVAAFTGLRISELRGLTWEAVDFEANTIRVFQRAGMSKDIGPPKSKKSMRTVHMGSETARVLKEWKLAQPTEQRAKGLVFANGAGNVETIQNLYRRFLWPLQDHLKMMVKGADGEKEPKFGFHAFRHFYASVLIALGRSPIDVQKSLGHADPAFTLRVYGHLFEARNCNRDLGNDIEDAVLAKAGRGRRS